MLTNVPQGNAVKLIDNLDVAQGIKFIDGKPRTSAMPYLYDIAEGNVANHQAWAQIGYTPTMTTAQSDIWSKAGTYVFCTTPGIWEVVSSSAANDVGTVIKGNAQGATAIQCDAGGTTTTLNDADVDFTAATAVAVGDCLLVDPNGTTPEYAYITGVATHTLTFAGGLSQGGSCATARSYTVVDKSASTGCQVVKVEYLTSAFVEKIELICTNNQTAVNSVNTDLYRLNGFNIIAAGSTGACVGNITLQADGAGTTYGYITATFTRARSSIYTVPTGKNLYVVSATFSYGFSGQNHEYARLYTRANVDPYTRFPSDGVFFPFTEVITQNAATQVMFDVPTKLVTGTDIKVSGIATASGIATVALRGWIETAS